MEFDGWISGFKVSIFPWIGGEEIYCNVQYYAPGQPIKSPVWDKTVYITNDEKGQKLVLYFKESLVKNIARLNIPSCEKVVITVDTLPLLIEKEKFNG